MIDADFGQTLARWFRLAHEGGFRFIALPQFSKSPPPAGWNREPHTALLTIEDALKCIERGINVGVCPVEAGAIIVDVDSLEALEAIGGEDQGTLSCKTPRGWQFLFAGNDGLTQTQCQWRIDIRSPLKGYGIAPGSRTDRGAYKEGQTPPGEGPWAYEALHVIPVIPIPESLVDAINAERALKGKGATNGHARKGFNVDTAAEAIETAAPGERHEVALSATMSVLHKDQSQGTYERLRDTFVKSTGESDRGKEYDRMWDGGVRKVEEERTAKTYAPGRLEPLDWLLASQKGLVAWDKSQDRVMRLDVKTNLWKQSGDLLDIEKQLEEIIRAKCGEALRNITEDKMRAEVNRYFRGIVRDQRDIVRKHWCPNRGAFFTCNFEAWELPTPDGRIWDLRTLTNKRINPDDHISTATAAIPEADGMDYDAWLDYVVSDAEGMDILDIALGQWAVNKDGKPDRGLLAYQMYERALCVLGYIGEQVVLFDKGEGDNGKTQDTELLARCLGKADGQFATSIDAEKVFGNETGGHDTWKTPFELARMVVVPEPPKGARPKVGLLKAISGGDTIDARHLHKKGFRFVSPATVRILCNEIPPFEKTDGGWRRRVRIIPWSFDAKAIGPDPTLGRKLWKHRGKYLWKVMQAAYRLLQLQEQGEEAEPPCEQVREATRAWLAGESYTEADTGHLIRYVAMFRKSKLCREGESLIQPLGVFCDELRKFIGQMPDAKYTPGKDFNKEVADHLRGIKGIIIKKKRYPGYRGSTRCILGMEAVRTETLPPTPPALAMNSMTLAEEEAIHIAEEQAGKSTHVDAVDALTYSSLHPRARKELSTGASTGSTEGQSALNDEVEDVVRNWNMFN